MNETQSKAAIRIHARHTATALLPSLKYQYAHQLATIVKSLTEFIESEKIALYWPLSYEINPLPLLNDAWALGKKCYLPILHPLHPKKLWFTEYQRGDSLIKNRFGLSEPNLKRPRQPAWALDLVLVPLLAFDKQGHRLGTGGGYYDYSFAFLKEAKKTRHPKLIGLAYALQEMSILPVDPWDIPLIGTATELGYLPAVNTVVSSASALNKPLP